MINPIQLRIKAVNDGRAMVRVKYTDTGELCTAAVCPGCWNDPDRRFTLLKQMENMGVIPVHKDDLNGGVFRPREHAPQCPHKKKIEQSWKTFKSVIKRYKS